MKWSDARIALKCARISTIGKRMGSTFLKLFIGLTRRNQSRATAKSIRTTGCRVRWMPDGYLICANLLWMPERRWKRHYQRRAWVERWEQCLAGKSAVAMDQTDFLKAWFGCTKTVRPDRLLGRS